MIQYIFERELPGRWKRLQDAMREIGADGCLLSTPVNLYYMTGRVYNGYFYLQQEGEPRFLVKRPIGLINPHLAYIRKPEQIPAYLAMDELELPRRLLLEADELSHTDYMRIATVFPKAEFLNATTVLRRLREIKSPFEIKELRVSAKCHSEVYADIPKLYKKGMSDILFQIEIERRMRRRGSYGLFRTYGANMEIFMGSLLAGTNAEAPSPYDFALGGEGVDPSYPLGADGSPLCMRTSVMVDMAGNYTPYITDMTRVFSIGKLPDEAYRVHNVSIAIHRKIAEMARPGVACADLYACALKMATDAGLEHNFMGTKQQAKFVGHGIGLQINELPVLTPRSTETLKEGMVFALEPKFVLPNVGALGIEDSYLVTADGVEKLTQAPEEIIRLQ